MVKTKYSRSLGKISICVQKRLGKMKKYGKKGTPKNVCQDAIQEAIYRCTEYRNVLGSTFGGGDSTKDPGK